MEKYIYEVKIQNVGTCHVLALDVEDVIAQIKKKYKTVKILSAKLENIIEDFS